MTIADALLDVPSAAPAATDTRATSPVVSVVIPAKNAGAYIGETIDSALMQDGVGEVIVVDDGSADDTVTIVQSIDDPRLHLMTNDATGVSTARNLGARNAHGKWLIFLDADDRLRPGAVTILLNAATTAPRAVLVYGDYNTIDSAGQPIGRRGLLKGRLKPSGDVLERLASGNFIVNGGIMLVRADAFHATGGFDASLRYCEDWHCWCRLAALGEFAYVPKLLLDYRLHTTNTMSAAVRTPEDFFPAVARVFSDELILSKLPADATSRLRQAVEIHLVTYSATQAVRFRRYRDALAYLGMVGRRSLKAMPRSAAKIALAWFGI